MSFMQFKPVYFSIVVSLFTTSCSSSYFEENALTINDTVYSGGVLREKAVEVDPSDRDTKKVAELLIEKAALGINAVGLAAPQVGIGKAIFVYRVPSIINGTPDFPENWNIAINASYEPISDETELMNEGCFSVPHFYSRSVPRYKKIKYSYNNLDGDIIRGIADGFKSQIIQHETDHLNGILYIDKLENTGVLDKR